MTTHLLLLRHGKAEDEPVDNDFHRELSDKGKRQVQRMAVWLQQHELIPDTVISSTAPRALTSAQKCCKAMGIGAQAIIKHEKIYHGTEEDLLQLIGQHLPQSTCLMMVGHNPAMHELLRFIAAPSSLDNHPRRLPTGGLAHFHLPDDPIPGKGTAELIHLINPKTLPKGFPYPTPSSSELRKRPSYYYTQSSVIPYRMNDGLLEILITRSSQKKHWVIPKGIADPGHSLRESAAKEALEEAGVKGEVANEAVGQYQYEKWGATCTVTVYPMIVTDVLDDDEWAEKHRGRQWLTASQAAATVRQPEVGRMIKLLEQQLCPA